MQILSSALPGFRDLRAPVVAGYMWLLFVWLVVQPDPGHRPENEIGAALFDLGQEVGRIWVGIATGVVAYLVGSISVVISDWLSRVGFVFSGGWLSAAESQEEGLGDLVEQGKAALEAAEGRLRSEQAQYFEELLQRRAAQAREEAARELDLPAILLVGDQPELFAEVDRERSEGELRTAVSIPLIAINVLCAVMVSGWWLFAIPGILILFWQGVRKDVSARISIANAIRLEKASSVASSRFQEWVEKTFTEAVKKAEVGGYDPADDRPPTLTEMLQGRGAMD